MFDFFKKDVFTVKRPSEIKENGEVNFEYTTVYSDIPCHLSVRSNSVLNQSQSTATVLYDYTLFYNKSLNVTILPNDKLEVTSPSGKLYYLRAGESVNYSLTVQTACEEDKIV